MRRRGVRVIAGGAVLLIAAVVAMLMLAVPAAASIPRPQAQVPQGEPRYTVEVQSFKALDEWGWEWDSDEVFGVFDSTRGYQTATSLYRNVDTGDRINLPRDEQCLAPQRTLAGSASDGLLWAPEDRWECDPRGVPAPFSVELELWEDEGCNPFFPSCFDGYNGGPVDSADGLIGRAEATYTAAELASRLRTVGSTVLQAFTLGGPCGYQPPNHVCGIGLKTGPEYQVMVAIHRVSDAPLRSSQ